jgi:hypothetical protein
MGTLVPRFMGLASCRIAELHRRRRQLRHAVTAEVDEVHERLPVYSFPLSWAFYCNPGLVPKYNITQPISLLVNLRSSSRPVFPFHLATACCAAPSHSVCRPRVPRVPPLPLHFWYSAHFVLALGALALPFSIAYQTRQFKLLPAHDLPT